MKLAAVQGYDSNAAIIKASMERKSAICKENLALESLLTKISSSDCSFEPSVSSIISDLLQNNLRFNKLLENSEPLLYMETLDGDWLPYRTIKPNSLDGRLNYKAVLITIGKLIMYTYLYDLCFGSPVFGYNFEIRGKCRLSLYSPHKIDIALQFPHHHQLPEIKCGLACYEISKQ
jgi:hypothetical protein